MNMKQTGVAAVAALALCGNMANATLIENGGFESGLSFWDHSCNVVAKHSWWGVTVPEGNLMAVMSPLGVLDSSLSQGFDPEEADAVHVSFDYNLVSFDFTSCRDYGTDSFTVSLGDQTWAYPINDLWDCRGRSYSTGWLQFDQEVNISSLNQGGLRIGFNVQNDPPRGDWGQLMAAFVDNVKVDPVTRTPAGMPVPDGTFPLSALACALAAVEFLRRRLAK